MWVADFRKNAETGIIIHAQFLNENLQTVTLIKHLDNRDRACADNFNAIGKRRLKLFKKRIKI